MALFGLLIKYQYENERTPVLICNIFLSILPDVMKFVKIDSILYFLEVQEYVT